MIEIKRTEPDIAQDRFFRYAKIRYSSLGPVGLKKALLKAKRRLTEDNFIDEEGFWELFNDLKSHNGWETAEVLAFLDLCNFTELS